MCRICAASNGSNVELRPPTWIHKTLNVTPAMQAGISKTLWGVEDLVGLMDLATSNLTGHQVTILFDVSIHPQFRRNAKLAPAASRGGGFLYAA